MDTAKVSSKYQIVIPRRLRRQLDLRPGQKLRLVFFDGELRLIPVRPIAELQGYFKGLDTNFVREADDVERP